jgi:hypothetical protein
MSGDQQDVSRVTCMLAVRAPTRRKENATKVNATHGRGDWRSSASIPRHCHALPERQPSSSHCSALRQRRGDRASHEQSNKEKVGVFELGIGHENAGEEKKIRRWRHEFVSASRVESASGAGGDS